MMLEAFDDLVILPKDEKERNQIIDNMIKRKLKYQHMDPDLI